MNDPVFTVDEPSKWGQWFQADETRTSLTVSRHVLYPNPSTDKVCLGYHAPRVDAAIGNASGTFATVEVTGTLTMEENAVLAVGTGGRVQPYGSFECIGNPLNLGWNYVINPKGPSSVVGSVIRSPRKGNGLEADGVTVGLDPITVELRFTRFLFLDAALAVSYETSTVAAESCRFEWCNSGMSAYFASVSAKNCLFRDCRIGLFGMAGVGTLTAQLCTFDRNQFGISTLEAAVNATDSIFASNAFDPGFDSAYGPTHTGIHVETLPGPAISEKHNAFWKLHAARDDPGGLHETSIILPIANSPYHRLDPGKNESTWFLRGRLNNLLDPWPTATEVMLEDFGTKPLADYGLLDSAGLPNGFIMSVSRHGIPDTGIADIGYHRPVTVANPNVLPAEWTSYFGVSSPTADQDQDAADGLSNLEEYKSGTNPLKRDTDEDRFVNQFGQDVGLDSNTFLVGEQRRLGFANGPGRCDLRLGPYVQISQLQEEAVEMRIYWAYANEWVLSVAVGPQGDTFLFRRGNQDVFSTIEITDCEGNCSLVACGCQTDLSKWLATVTLSAGNLSAGELIHYKVRFQIDPK